MDQGHRGLGYQHQGHTKYGPQLNGQGRDKYGPQLNNQGPPQDPRWDRQHPIGSRFTHLTRLQECALLMLALPLPPHKEQEQLLPRTGEGLLHEHLPAPKGEIGPPPEDLGNIAEASPAQTPWMMSLVIRHPGGDEISLI